MLPAKDGVRICTCCGGEFVPRFPDTGTASDEKCFECEVMDAAPAWWIGFGVNEDDALDAQKEETA